MPAYNGMKYLKQAVDSVLAQSYQDWELLISDDCSSDGTRQLLAGLRDPRIKIHLQPTNLNIFGNLNFLFDKASGKIAQILCQDDYLIDQGGLERLAAEWSALPPEVAFLRSNHMLDANSNLSRFEGSVMPSIVRPEQSDLLFFIFGCIPGNLSNVSVRTEAVQDAGWFRTDLPYAGDFEFWSRLGASRPWAITRTKVTIIRSHSEQASRTMSPKGEVMPQLRFILELLYQRLIAKGYSPARLRLMATSNYISLQRDAAVKALVIGKGSGHLQAVAREFDTATFSLTPLLGWLVYFATLGGRILRVPIASRMLRDAAR
jgi:glycosyltransferase involved in cell wall biosynthesis